MFGWGPAYLFVLQHRLPIELMRVGSLGRMAINLAVFLAAAGLIEAAGLRPASLISSRLSKRSI
jgi:acyl-lipid omega-6 desaturase (Delta-12 desaturase)